MNNHTTRFHRPASVTSLRAQFSPLSNRVMTRGRGRPAARDGVASPALAVPAAESLTPATPWHFGRLLDPHLLDRLQVPLSRIRE